MQMPFLPPFAPLRGVLVSIARRNSTLASVTRDPSVCEVTLTHPTRRVAHLSLNRPAARNAIGRTFLEQLRSHIASLHHQSPQTRVLIIKSDVDNVFCAGADLKERLGMTKDQVRYFVRSLRAGFQELEALPIPTIAAINGAALGGGLELALSCDIRLGGPLCRVGLPETSLAIIPGAGGTQRLPRLIGVPAAKYLIYTAAVLGHTEARRYGIINEALDCDPLERATEIAEAIASKGPVAMKMAKKAIDKGMEANLALGLEIEELCYAQVVETEDRLEGLRAFREKRRPEYSGR